MYDGLLPFRRQAVGSMCVLKTKKAFC